MKSHLYDNQWTMMVRRSDSFDFCMLQAEEQKRAAAMKLREQEEATAMKRKLEEAKQVKKPVTKKKEVNEYKCTPTRDERPLKKPKTEEDYGLEDASASDSSEDESNPKKEIPSWAQRKFFFFFIVVYL